MPHLAHVVEDLDTELQRRNSNTIFPPNIPSDGVRVAMIEHNDAAIELM